MISIICVYNNEDVLNKFLLKSLKDQTKDYELILLDNQENNFKSAAEALNYGGKKAHAEYFMFVHQDIDLCSNNALENMEKILDTIPDLGIAGVAGKNNRKGVFTNIKHGTIPKFAGKFQIKKHKKVQTLDECLVIIPKKVFRILQFDEYICNNWHLYSVDYSLSVKKLGLFSYVIPINLYHRSAAFSLNDEYYKTLDRLLKKHKKHYKFIYTPMGNWNTFMSLKFQRNSLWNKFITALNILQENCN